MPANGRRPPSLLANPSYLASQVSRYGRERMDAVLAEHDLARPHHGVLSALEDFGALSQQELADACDLDKSRVVTRVDELQARGLVQRRPNPSDRRRNQITITPAGAALLARINAATERSQERFLDVLSPTERVTLITLLQRILAANDAARDHKPA